MDEEPERKFPKLTNSVREIVKARFKLLFSVETSGQRQVARAVHFRPVDERILEIFTVRSHYLRTFTLRTDPQKPMK